MGSIHLRTVVYHIHQRAMLVLPVYLLFLFFFFGQAKKAVYVLFAGFGVRIEREDCLSPPKKAICWS